MNRNAFEENLTRPAKDICAESVIRRKRQVLTYKDAEGCSKFYLIDQRFNTAIEDWIEIVW